MDAEGVAVREDVALEPGADGLNLRAEGSDPLAHLRATVDPVPPVCVQVPLDDVAEGRVGVGEVDGCQRLVKRGVTAEGRSALRDAGLPSLGVGAEASIRMCVQGEAGKICR